VSGTVDYVFSKDLVEVVISMCGAIMKAGVIVALRAAIALGNRLKNPVLHVSISLPRDERLTRKEWGEIAEKYMERMGYGQTKWIAVLHSDTEYEHIHIVASRVDIMGRTVSDSMDWLRSEEIMRELEREYGLTQLPGREERAEGARFEGARARGKVQARVHIDEGERWRGGGVVTRLEEAVRAVGPVARVRGEEDMVREQALLEYGQKLRARGVRVVLKVLPGGEGEARPVGVVYEMEGLQLSGRRIGPEFSLHGMEARLGEITVEMWARVSARLDARADELEAQWKGERVRGLAEAVRGAAQASTARGWIDELSGRGVEVAAEVLASDPTRVCGLRLVDATTGEVWEASSVDPSVSWQSIQERFGLDDHAAATDLFEGVVVEGGSVVVDNPNLAGGDGEVSGDVAVVVTAARGAEEVDGGGSGASSEVVEEGDEAAHEVEVARPSGAGREEPVVAGPEVARRLPEVGAGGGGASVRGDGVERVAAGPDVGSHPGGAELEPAQASVVVVAREEAASRDREDLGVFPGAALAQVERREGGGAYVAPGPPGRGVEPGEVGVFEQDRPIGDMGEEASGLEARTGVPGDGVYSGREVDTPELASRDRRARPDVAAAGGDRPRVQRALRAAGGGDGPPGEPEAYVGETLEGLAPGVARSGAQGAEPAMAGSRREVDTHERASRGARGGEAVDQSALVEATEGPEVAPARERAQIQGGDHGEDGGDVVARERDVFPDAPGVGVTPEAAPSIASAAWARLSIEERIEVMMRRMLSGEEAWESRPGDVGGVVAGRSGRTQSIEAAGGEPARVEVDRAGEFGGHAELAAAVERFNREAGEGVPVGEGSWPGWRQPRWKLSVDPARADLVRIEVEVVDEDRQTMATHASRDAYPGGQIEALRGELLSRAPGPGDLKDLHMQRVSSRALTPAEAERVGAQARAARAAELARVIEEANLASVVRADGTPGEVPGSRQARWQFALMPGDPEHFNVRLEMTNSSLTRLVTAADMTPVPIARFEEISGDLLSRPVMLAEVTQRPEPLIAFKATPLSAQRTKELLEMRARERASPAPEQAPAGAPAAHTFASPEEVRAEVGHAHSEGITSMRVHEVRVSSHALTSAEAERVGAQARAARVAELARVIEEANLASVVRADGTPGEVPGSRQARWLFSLVPDDPEHFNVGLQMTNSHLNTIVTTVDPTPVPIARFDEISRELLSRPVMRSDVKARSGVLVPRRATPLSAQRTQELLEMRARERASRAPAQAPAGAPVQASAVVLAGRDEGSPQGARPGTGKPPGIEVRTLQEYIEDMARETSMRPRVLGPGESAQGKVLSEGLNTGDRGYFEVVIAELGAISLIEGGRDPSLDPYRDAAGYTIFVEVPFDGGPLEIEDVSMSPEDSPRDEGDWQGVWPQTEKMMRLGVRTLDEFMDTVTRETNVPPRVLGPGEFARGKVLSEGLNTGDRGYFEVIRMKSGVLALIEGGRNSRLDPYRGAEGYDTHVRVPMQGGPLLIRDVSRSRSRGR
jgi:hypothetical protein